jgi:ATP-dependent DNA helicase RecQ
MPGTLEAYYQEAGRAGRDGLDSDCVLLHAFQDRFTHEFFIKGSYPDRETVDRVYQALQRAADDTGLVGASIAEVAPLVRGSKEREVESAVRILIQWGVVRNEQPNSSRYHVRLLASPERIKRELGASRAVERDLLRALWRAVGAQLQTGAVIDPDGLPPGFGFAPGVAASLDALQAEQFVMWKRVGGGLRLANARAALDSFPIDWALLDRRRAADMAKLDAMQRYAYVTGCRRGFVLRYFGDPAGRGTCQGCDNCLGTHHYAAETSASEPRERKPRSSRVRDASPEAVGLDGAAPASRRSRRGTPAAQRFEPPDAEAMSPEDARMLAELKSLRSRIAREEGVPAYVVFPDRTLLELAVRRPRTADMMSSVHGVGPARLDKYGQRFLEVLRSSDGTEAA